jgi:hypothetical protein
MDNAFTRDEWIAYYSQKRILHQWTQLSLLTRTPGRRVLEVGPAIGLVTAMLANGGYDVTTLDQVEKPFARPQTPHLRHDVTTLTGTEIAGFDAILCCETLEHLDWEAVGGVLAAFRASGARNLIVSVPYMGFQVTLDFYANRLGARHYFSLKKLLFRREFRREPAGGHQWEVGYKGMPLRRWEARLKENGWAIVRREFTAHTRSVFHLLEAR